MKNIFPLLLLFFLFNNCSVQDERPLVINFAGDMILDRGVEDELSIYGDSLLSRYLLPLTDGDFNLVNLETVLTNLTKPVRKGIVLRNGPEVSDFLNGITHASLANNHSFDFGKKGFEDTQNALKKNNISAVGLSVIPHLISKNGQKVGIMSFSAIEGIDQPSYTDSITVLKNVREFRFENPQTPLIIYLHWGLEYQLKPQPWQQQFAHRLMDIGVDAIIGHHPHVFQSVEIYKGKPIIYSLGNFVADAYLPGTTEGVVARMVFNGYGIETALIPIDLSTYFPERMSSKDEIKFFSENLKYSPELCYYKAGDQWLIKKVDSVDFKEDASDWLFHYENQYGVLISKLISGDLRLSVTKNGIPNKPMLIHGELSEIHFADITNDGRKEMLLGISKMVNFDQRNKKRINVFRMENGNLQVVWLGTKFINELISFRTVNNFEFTYLETKEIDPENKVHNRIYLWDEFGFALNNLDK